MATSVGGIREESGKVWQLQKENEAYREETKQQKREITDLKSQLQDRDQTINNLQTDINTFQAQMNMIQTAAQNAIADCTRSLATINAEHAEFVKKTDREINELKETVQQVGNRQNNRSGLVWLICAILCCDCND